MNPFLLVEIPNTFSNKVYNLHSTNDGEPSEETHVPSNCRYHIYKLHSTILFYFIKCRCVKENPNIS